MRIRENADAFRGAFEKLQGLFDRVLNRAAVNLLLEGKETMEILSVVCLETHRVVESIGRHLS